jgi:4-hydroxybenzoate polyprenyltransferase
MYAPDPESIPDSTPAGLVYELRPWQWYKQLVLFIPLVFSGSADDPSAWLRIVSGALLFSAVAGSTYVLNDVSDLEQDRNHPRKRHRPIASGVVSVPFALVFAGGVYALSGALSWLLDPLFFGLVALYVGQNVVYSYFLKQYLFVDLLSISVGFVIRAVAGIILISVQLSPWLLLCTFLAALLLGTSKRWGERSDADDPTVIRENLDSYTTQTLRFIFMTVSAILLMAYSLYTFFARDLLMMLTIPFAFYAVFRYAHLTFVLKGDSEPITLLLDRQILINLFLWGMTIVIILYRGSFGVSS